MGLRKKQTGRHRWPVIHVTSSTHPCALCNSLHRSSAANLVRGGHGSTRRPGAGRDGAAGCVAGGVKHWHAASGDEHRGLPLAAGIDGQDAEDCARWGDMACEC